MKLIKRGVALALIAAWGLTRSQDAIDVKLRA